mmetsp:Transcript_24684/g.56725  ORF Transcript_24684/g.56725 Transcript_24684/m.56725 type:complete len:332 (-) Transcript_24684:201-1196(-)
MRIQLLQRGNVGNGVLLAQRLGLVPESGSYHRLHFVGVDDTSQIRIGHGGGGHGLPAGSVHGLQSRCRRSRPHDEPSHVSSRCQLEEVETGHFTALHPGQIAEGAFLIVSAGVDHQGTAAHFETAVAGFSLSGTDLFARGGLLHVSIGAHGFQSLDGGRGLGGPRDHGVFHHQRDLGDFGDGVAPRHDERGHGGGGQGRSHRVTLLGGVDLAVPLAPGLGGSEHAAAAAHVSEGTLPGAGGSAAAHAGNTGDGAPGAPGGGGGGFAGGDVDGVGLATVLGHVAVDGLDQVASERGDEDRGEGNAGVGDGFAGTGEDGDQGADGGHFQDVKM